MAQWLSALASNLCDLGSILELVVSRVLSLLLVFALLRRLFLPLQKTTFKIQFDAEEGCRFVSIQLDAEEGCRFVSDHMLRFYRR